MATVTLQHVHRTFRDRKREVHAVYDLSLDVADGELLALVGPSGCGKTTTLRLIAGLDDLSAGTVQIGDRVVNDMHPKDRDVAMVFQNYALYPHMTVYQNIAFPLKMRKLPRVEIRRKVAETAEKLGLTTLLARKPAQLSGGEKQRTAVGRAIVRNPKVFLLDEPLSNLDARLRVELRSEIKRLQRELRTTTIYVTHDQEEAMTLGDRIAVLRDGVLQQCGTPLEVYDQPANRFVAGFIGSPAMNVIDGALESSDGEVHFRSGAIRLPLPDLWRGADGTAAMTLGVRPQHVHLLEAGGPGTLLPLGMARIRFAETTGEAWNVRLSLGGLELVARTSPEQAVREGSEVRVAIDPSRLHFFAAGGGGGRISQPANGPAAAKLSLV